MRNRGAALILGLLLLSSCGPGRPFSFCKDNGDCETNLTCFQNQCLHLGTVPDGLVWEISRLGGTASQAIPTPQQVQSLRFSPCRPSVRGDISSLGRARVDIEGEHEHLPGVCIMEQRTLSGEFQLSLSAGSYRLTFTPEGGPPHTETFTLGRCQHLDLGELQPRPTTLLRFLPTHGERDPRPRCGVRAQAFDPSTGDPLSKPLAIGLSSQFECAPPSPDGWELEVALPEEGSTALLVVDSLANSSPVMRRLVTPIELQEEFTLVGALPTKAAPAERALILVEDPSGHPVEGVSVTGRWPEGSGDPSCLAPRPSANHEEGGDASFPAAMAQSTGSPGSYEIWLPPGPYHFEATPPSATKLAVATQAPVFIREGGGNFFPIRLPEKHILSGVVTGPQRSGLSNAKVIARALGPSARTFETRTDSRGRYELGVDPGRYALVVEAEEPDLARAWAFLGTVEESRTENFSVSHPRVIAGTVRLQEVEGDASPQAFVRVWDVQGVRPILAGETVTDEEGRFVLLLRR